MIPPSLVHIYACCPSALTTGRLTHFFGPQHGRFLDPFPFTKPRYKTWAHKDLTQDEKKRLKEILTKLTTIGAVQKSLPKEAYLSTDTSVSILGELNKKVSKITFGLLGEPSNLSKKSKRILTVKEFEDNNSFTIDPVQLDVTPTAFIEHVPEFIVLSAKRFKLIDPYIFNITSEEHAAKRLEFIYQIIQKYFSIPENEDQPVTFEVYGKEDKGLSLDLLKKRFSKFRKLFEINWPVTIKFFVAERIKKTEEINSFFNKKKLHERFFCADKYYFSFEDSSEDRREKWEQQTWRIETSKGYRSFIDSYNEDSQFLKIKEHFDSRQLEILGRN